MNFLDKNVLHHDGEDVDDDRENLQWANYYRALYTWHEGHYKDVVVHNVEDVQYNLGDSDGENRGELNDEALNFYFLLHYGVDGGDDVGANDARPSWGVFFHQKRNQNVNDDDGDGDEERLPNVDHFLDDGEAAEGKIYSLHLYKNHVLNQCHNYVYGHRVDLKQQKKIET